MYKRQQVVLFSIADGVISLKDLKRVGSVGVKTFIYYMITTALAVVIGLILVNIFKMCIRDRINARLRYNSPENRSAQALCEEEETCFW